MNTWLVWGLIVPSLLVTASLVSIWSAGRFAKRNRGAPSTAIAPGQGTPLDDLLAPHEDRHAGQSAVALIDDPAQALRQRLALAQLSGRSLDLLYYIWDDDLSGRLLARALLEAADRGVRVRMLLDDVNVLNRDPAYRALDRHPGIEVRLFNPIRNRDRGVRRGIEILLNALPYNRRMHGKLWLADGRVGLTGGRNIADEYFGLASGRDLAPHRDYDDLDTLLAGQVLRDAEALFDAFWNSGVALPIRTLWPGKRTRLGRFRKRLAAYLDHPRSVERLREAKLHRPEDAAGALVLEQLHWTPTVTFLGDPPHKALGTEPDGWMPASLLPLVREATRSLRIVTPYFVPGTQGLTALASLAATGVKVEIITNGLAMADNVLVYGAYRWARDRLLGKNVSIYEVAALSEPRRMLHSKAFLVDDRKAFIGSFNFDQRSAFLNTEMGVVFEDPVLVKALRAMIDKTRAPDNAFAVALDGRRPVWSRGETVSTHIEPESNALKRAVTYLIGHLPIHRFL
ncbi:MAG: phosphatidylserine/phosphatidylglycerophosphate/cardiolipin synthase family protein [Rhodobacteraceae bacterium]|jgi:putative cardiolipin synthase|nr:phosphatidylserine/phosphatidylglycerophosphate/cardiolipin synthase family protein [Paracoccaceae bacterium]